MWEINWRKHKFEYLKHVILRKNRVISDKIEGWNLSLRKLNDRKYKINRKC